MKVEWVRIKDFRSISDTGKLYIDPILTVLAGKNESGKSNILRALEVFSTTNFSDEDYPEGKTKEESNPEIEVSFKLDLEDIRKFSMWDYEHHPYLEEKFYSFTISKDLKGNRQRVYGSIQRYFISKNFLDLIEEISNNLIVWTHDPFVDEKIKVNAEPLYREGLEFLAHFLKQEEPIYWLMSYKDKVRDLYDYINKLIKSNPNSAINNSIKSLHMSSEKIKKFFDLSADAFFQYESFKEKIKIPNFKLLESFEKPLPDSVSLIDESEEVCVSYIQKALGGNEGSSFATMSNREIKRVLDRVSEELTSLFQSVYTQNQVRIEFDMGINNTLDVYIYDGENSIDFMPSQRSKGFQWFLSFFFAINATQKAGDIILIDEPGPYLHPKAQNDVLKALETLAKSNQIIFTTHSPYLINPDTLERIRLVDKDDDNGTFIENQVHASSAATQEIYTPIITAIGLDLSKSFGTFGEHNIIVEGISDYYYLESMKEHINYNEESGIMRFTPSIGAPQIDKFACLLRGWGVNFKVLLDNDNAGKAAKKKLKNGLLLSEEQLVFVSEEPGFAIEDLFSREDFLAYVVPNLEISEENKDLKNSSLLSGRKALIAKVFKERLQKEDIMFTPQTIDNFTSLFRKLYGVNDVRAEEMESIQ
ncbi:AAA family ATPase [Bacillus cereus group sp. BfR-BA-01445]|uniref:AAA family ATPase n=1 Tax=Bacillus cereus group sp. BfR-BA-01445 TaxID=2920349 RepID=UPI001F561BAA|nr:AAA family ATPase [Bacillus cereus group sp. BfR-BA-01445]